MHFAILTTQPLFYSHCYADIQIWTFSSKIIECWVADKPIGKQDYGFIQLEFRPTRHGRTLVEYRLMSGSRQYLGNMREKYIVDKEKSRISLGTLKLAFFNKKSGNENKTNPSPHYGRLSRTFRYSRWGFENSALWEKYGPRKYHGIFTMLIISTDIRNIRF